MSLADVGLPVPALMPGVCSTSILELPISTLVPYTKPPTTNKTPTLARSNLYLYLEDKIDDFIWNKNDFIRFSTNPVMDLFITFCKSCNVSFRCSTFCFKLRTHFAVNLDNNSIFSYYEVLWIILRPFACMDRIFITQ